MARVQPTPERPALPAATVLAVECRHLGALLAQGLLLERDVDAALARMRAALLVAIGKGDQP
ncbi:hypothetical protein DFO45_4864 [Azorhizobium sp. AG788]|uniref:hypothetical protein n=1 Tax=Azorhizobium sp. AG788 TaxID=2183897 RepID=UPI00106219DC|nr:hypothetical protein [Azorhizobium sp. AG788]TDT88075.1 hypothetical protein DFO45_4864 [Azorhizobium sp. AG788]